MTPPTTTQQRALAYAGKPFALFSFLASTFMIYHLLYQQPQKRKRMYHRLVLPMNLSILVQSSADFWGTLAVPEGTPYYAGARGTVETCRAQGFLSIMFSLTVPVYYASLSIYSFLAIKNKFQEEKYRWIEKWIHTIAIFLPLIFATIMAMKDNIEPAGSGCYAGNTMKIVVYVFGFGQLFVYITIPASAMIAVWRLMKKVKTERESAQGMRRIIESARKNLLYHAAHQICLYLFSFWFTYIFSVAQVLIYFIQGQRNYNLTIFANCIYICQGFFMMLVYFQLQKMSKPKDAIHSKFTPSTITSVTHSKKRETVSDIRANAEANNSSDGNGVTDDTVGRTCAFSIFDGTPPEDSPWAQYIGEDDDDDGDDVECNQDEVFPGEHSSSENCAATEIGTSTEIVVQ